MPTKIISTHGHFLAHADGRVIHSELDDSFGPCPVFVNWAEWDKAYNYEPRPAEMDILDIGYIRGDGEYVPPSEDWRKDRKDMQADTARDKRLSDFFALCRAADLIYVDGLHATDDWTIFEDGQAIVFDIAYSNGDVARFTADEIANGTRDNEGYTVYTDEGSTTLEFYTLTKIDDVPTEKDIVC